MNKNLRTFYMPEEIQPQTQTLMGPLDDTRYVRDNKALVLGHADQPQLRTECSKRVVCDLRLCRGGACDQSGLARIGQSNDAHIGQKLQFTPKPLGFSRVALFGPFGQPARGRDESGVSTSPFPAFGSKETLSGTTQVFQDLSVFRVSYQGAHGDLYDPILSLTTV